MILYVGLPPTLTFGPRSAFARLASSTLVLIALRLTNCQLNAVSLSTRNLDSVVAARLWIFLQTDCGLAKPHDTEGVCGAYLSGPVVDKLGPGASLSVRATQPQLRVGPSKNSGF